MSRLVTTVIHMDTPESIARQVSAEIRAAMKLAGMSQRDMAAKTGIPLVTLGRRLTGGKPFDIAELAAVASTLNIGVVDLMLRAERASSKAAA